MKKHKNLILILILIICIVIGYFIYNRKESVMTDYSTNLFYMDTYINVKIYADSEEKAKEGFKIVEDVYKKYQLLTNRYDKDSQVYNINNNTSSDKTITLDSDLYNMISLGYTWYKKSNDLFNINMGNVIDVWKKYRDLGTGIPMMDELKNSGSININKIVLLGNNKISNTRPNVDLGGIAKGYATKEAGLKLQEANLDYFIINAGGNVLVGKSTKVDGYSIGIESPVKQSKIYQVVHGENITVVTSGGYERFYEYNGIRYHHIIDPDTLMPCTNMQSVTIVATDSAIADILSTSVFLMSVEDGLKYINNMDDIEAIWYKNDGTIVKSDGFDKYE